MMDAGALEEYSLVLFLLRYSVTNLLVSRTLLPYTSMTASDIHGILFDGASNKTDSLLLSVIYVE